MNRKAYEKPAITTIDSAAVLEQIGPAQASVSGAEQATPYSTLDSRAGGGSSSTFGR